MVRRSRRRPGRTSVATTHSDYRRADPGGHGAAHLTGGDGRPREGRGGHRGGVARAGGALTAGEEGVLTRVGQPLTTAQIAETLSTSVRTVDSHVAALLRKLQAPDRRTLARKAAVERIPG